VPGLGAMEFAILFFPIIEIWEFKKRQRRPRGEPGHAKFSKYSLAALEKALRDDIERLEEFAATKDLTGENIIFLKQVENWKEKWRSSGVNLRSGGVPPPVLRALYSAAKEIFQTLVHKETSSFPLNLDDDIYLILDQAFGDSNPGLRRNLSADYFNTHSKATIAPFADDVIANARCLPERKEFREICGEDPKAGAGVAELEIDPDRSAPPRENCAKGSQLPWIPEDLEKVFDGAEVAVKQMVLTNTWTR